MKFRVEGKALKKALDAVKVTGNDMGVRVQNGQVHIWTIELNRTAGYIFELEEAEVLEEGEVKISADDVKLLTKFVPGKAEIIEVYDKDGDVYIKTSTRKIRVPIIAVANIPEYEQVKEIIDAVQKNVKGKVMYTKTDAKDIVANATEGVVTFEGSEVKIKAGTRSEIVISAMEVSEDGIHGTYSVAWLKPVITTIGGELIEFMVDEEQKLLIKTYSSRVVANAVVAPLVEEYEEGEEEEVE